MERLKVKQFLIILSIFFTVSDSVYFEVNWVSIPSSVYLWASSIAVFQETKRVSKSQGSKILFLLNLFKKFVSINFYFNAWLSSNYY